MGRASKRNPKIESTILAGLRLGVPLAELCRRPGMPCAETWRNWCRADYDLEEAYAGARTVGYDVILEELRHAVLAGAPLNDCRVAERVKLAAKWDPLSRK